VSRSDPMVLGFLAEAAALPGAVADGLRTLSAGSIGSRGGFWRTLG